MQGIAVYTVFLEAQNGFEKGAETSSVDFYAQLDWFKPWKQ